MSTPLPRIFISHSSKDHSFCIRLVDDLRRLLGDDDAVWYDARGGLFGGDPWWSKIVTEIRSRDTFLIVLSPDALASPWVTSEFDLAWKQKQSPEGKTILPLLYRPCSYSDSIGSLPIISFLSPKTYSEALQEILIALGLPSLTAQVSASSDQSGIVNIEEDKALPIGDRSVFPQLPVQELLPYPKKMPLPLPRSKPHQITRKMLLIFALCFLLIIAGFSAYFTVTRYNIDFTAIDHTVPPATATANAYNIVTSRDGTQFGFNTGHTRYNPYEHILSSRNVPNLLEAWTALTGKEITSEPAVINGVVYVGSWDGTFYAFKADGCGQFTCSPLWVAKTGDFIFSSPAVADGVVYIASEDHKLYAFNADGCGGQHTCAPLWTGTAGGGIDSSPAVVNGMVYFGSYDHKLYAFRAGGCGQNTCSPVWTAQTGSVISSSPAVANGVIYVGARDGQLYAFNAQGCGQRSCAPLWTAQTGGFVDSSPTVANGKVYVGSYDAKLYAFNANGCGAQRTCAPLWTAQTDSQIFSSPAVANGVVYIGSLEGYFYAFPAQGCGQPTCTPLWTAQTSDFITYSSPSMANGVIYIGSIDSKLYAFNANGCGQPTCPPLWTNKTSAEIESPPTIANGAIYVGSGDGKLYVFHL